MISAKEAKRRVELQRKTSTYMNLIEDTILKGIEQNRCWNTAAFSHNIENDCLEFIFDELTRLGYRCDYTTVDYDDPINYDKAYLKIMWD